MHFRKIFSNELISFGKLKSHKITMPLLFEEKENPLLTARSNVGIVNERSKYMKNWDQYASSIYLEEFWQKAVGTSLILLKATVAIFSYIFDRYHDWLSSSITHNWNFNPSLLLKAKETQLCHKLNSKSHPAGHKDDKRTHCSEVETFTADLLWQFRCLCLGIHAFRIV